MLALPILAAAATVLAPPLPKGDIVTNSNYPQWALRQDKAAGVVYTLLVSPEGKIAKCMIRAKVGDDKLAGQVCEMIARRNPTMKPAVAADGTTAYGVYTDVVNFFIPGEPGSAKLPIARAPDAEFTVNALPNGMTSPADIEVAVEVGTKGTVEHCGVAGKKPSMQLSQIACKELAGSDLGVMNLGGSNTVPYVRTVSVRFKTAS